MTDEQFDEQMLRFEERIAKKKERQRRQDEQEAERLRQEYLKRTGRKDMKP